LTVLVSALDKAIEQLVSKLNELKADLEKKQAEQTEDARGMNRQQKNTERYLAKKQMLTSRKDECNRSIRDLGVLPEEAFEKYTKDKVEKVSAPFDHRLSRLSTIL
jgi:structural maintenance of chromosome 3 (chondroitin sulfate proteoglycan 6)